MIAALDLISAGLILAGAVFVLIAGLGVVRMEDVFTRMHASTKAGTLGLGLIVAAFLLGSVETEWSAKAFAVLIFMLTTAPVGAHLVGRAVFRHMSKEERDRCSPSAAAEE